MVIHETNATVVRDNLKDAIKFFEVEFPDAYSHLKGLYTSYYLMGGDSYIEAVGKAEGMIK